MYFPQSSRSFLNGAAVRVVGEDPLGMSYLGVCIWARWAGVGGLWGGLLGLGVGLGSSRVRFSSQWAIRILAFYRSPNKGSRTITKWRPKWLVVDSGSFGFGVLPHGVILSESSRFR